MQIQGSLLTSPLQSKPLPYSEIPSRAALKGKAFQAAVKALKNLMNSSSSIHFSDEDSFNDIMIKKPAVFKRFKEKINQEQELRTLQLFGLMSEKGSAVESFHFSKISCDKLGIKIDQEIKDRGYGYSLLSKELLGQIKLKLSSEEKTLLADYEKKAISQLKLKQKIHSEEEQQWFFKQSEEEEWRSAKFKELQGLYRRDKLPNDARIGLTKENAFSFEKHMTSNSPFFLSLAAPLPDIAQSSEEAVLSPDLSDADVRKAYEICDHFLWTYTNESGSKDRVNFKTLLSQFLCNDQLKEIAPVPADETVIPTQEHLKTALNVKWKLFSPMIMQASGDHRQFSPLANFAVKPFVKMNLMTDLLASHPKMLNKVMDRLTLNAQWAAILSGEIQVFDLHGDNLGVVFEPNAKSEKYKKTLFQLPSGTSNFEELLTAFLDEEISADTRIEFKEEDRVISKKLRDLTDLQEALDVKWKFVFFDGDRCQGEDNSIQIRDEESLIPLRSVFLETDWKDTPLHPEIIAKLKNSTKRDSLVRGWISRNDAPLYQFLSGEAREQVDKMLKVFLTSYSLTGSSATENPLSLAKLQEKFVLEICYTHKLSYKPLWSLLEKELSSVPVRLEDTWEKLAVRYRQDVAALKKLNKEMGELPKPGKKITILYDLTSRQPRVGKARTALAKQLFPRLTLKQQKALAERQDLRTEYLNNYDKISSLKTGDLCTELTFFINAPSTPLSSLEREDFLLQIEKIKENFTSETDIHKALLGIKEEICKKCRPTYFNLMKAMYRLLADVFALFTALYKKKAGILIGNPEVSLEKAIKEAKSTFPKTSPQSRLAAHLQSEIVKFSTID